MSKKSKKNKGTTSKDLKLVGPVSNPTGKPQIPVLDWKDVTDLREQTIIAIQKPHEELIKIKESCGFIIEKDQELINTFNGLNSTYIDQLEQVKAITKEHSSVVKNDKGEEVLQFESGKIRADQDIDQAMKYFAIGQKYATLVESIEHTATVGMMNFLSAMERTHKKLAQEQFGLTDEQVAQIEAEEKEKEKNIEEFKNTYNGESLKEDFPKALSDVAKGESKFQENTKEDIDNITSDFQSKIDTMSKEEVAKGGSIEIRSENKE